MLKFWGVEHPQHLPCNPRRLRSTWHSNGAGWADSGPVGFGCGKGGRWTDRWLGSKESGEKNLGGWGVKLRTLKLWVVATQIIFSCSPLPGEMIHFDEHIFQLVGSTTN